MHVAALRLFSSVLRRRLRYNPKLAPNVYQLIDAELIGNSFVDPFLF